MQQFKKARAQVNDLATSDGPLLLGQLEGRRHAHGKRDRLGARALAALLMSAEEEWTQSNAATYQQGTDASGSVELVGAKAQRRGAKSDKRDLHFSSGLGSVAMQWSERSHWRHWLHGARLVVGQHQASEPGVGERQFRARDSLPIHR